MGERGTHALSIVEESDLTELLALMRAYCDFYSVSPSDEQLLGMARGLIADPEREGVQLIARRAEGAAGRGSTTGRPWLRRSSWPCR